VIYVFDPGAKGDRPLELMKEAAERYGYILAGSNNSHNGAFQPELDAASDMWRDTHSYLSIDDRRIFFAGFSGGARLASFLAQSCNCARAVLLNGATLRTGGPPLAQRNFAAFLAVGLGDFNYGEFVELDSKLDTAGTPHFLRRFDGEHQWAPAQVWDEAFAWSALLEMKNNLRQRDPGFVAAELARSNERIKKQLESGEYSFALQEVRAYVAAFDALIDTTALKQEAAALERDPATRNRARQEKTELERQHIVGDKILATIDSWERVGAGDFASVREIISKVRELHQNLAEEKKPSERRVLRRVLGSIYIMSIEDGGATLEKNDPVNAQSFFEVAAEARPDAIWPHLSLALCHAGRGDRKAALRDLKHALDTGYSVATLGDFVKNNPKLAALENTDEYKKLIATPPAQANPAK
jgi:hypothetical protein